MASPLASIASWTHRNRWRVAGSAFGVALLAWSFPRDHIEEMWTAMRSTEPQFIAAAMGLVLFNMIMRALRWMVLVGLGTRTGFGSAFSALMIGYLSNNFLPARGGDLVRVYAFGSLTGMARSRILATVAVERVLDMATIVIVVGIVAAASPIPPWMRQGGAVFAGGTAAGLVGLLLLRFVGDRFLQFLLRPVNKRAPRLASRLMRMGSEFIAGLGAVQRPAAAVLFLLFTAGIWALEIAIVLLAAQAFSLSLSPADGVILMLFSLFSSLIPALPGQFGLYEFAIVAGLDYTGHGGVIALPFALALHLVLIASTTILGLICLFTSGVSLFDARPHRQTQGG
jgi:uncharacterized protein (TIRG00374 family)